MFDNIETDRGSEGVQPQAAEKRNLDDATVEPRAYVERTGDIAKAEAVQKEFTEVAENVERSANQGAPKDDSGWIGESGGGQPGPVEREVRVEARGPAVAEAKGEVEREARTAAADRENREVEAGAQAAVSDGPQRLDAGPLPTDAADLPEARAEPGAEGSMPGGAGSPGGPMNVPDVEALIKGQGDVSGASGPTYVGNIPGHGGSQFGSRGGMPGGFEGMPDLPDGSGEMPSGGGFSSSGGGLGIRLGGSGAAEGDVSDPVATAMQAALEAAVAAVKSEPACKETADRIQGQLGSIEYPSDQWTVRCGDSVEIEYTVTAFGVHGPKIRQVQQGPDDGNPTPYTGRFGTTGLPTPEKANDTGRVLPDADLGGFGGNVWRADIDHTDDTGRFYGGIMSGPVKVYPDSGGARPIDPKRAVAETAPAEETGRKARRRAE